MISRESFEERILACALHSVQLNRSFKLFWNISLIFTSRGFFPICVSLILSKFNQSIFIKFPNHCHGPWVHFCQRKKRTYSAHPGLNNQGSGCRCQVGFFTTHQKSLGEKELTARPLVFGQNWPQVHSRHLVPTTSITFHCSIASLQVNKKKSYFFVTFYIIWTQSRSWPSLLHPHWVLATNNQPKPGCYNFFFFSFFWPAYGIHGSSRLHTLCLLSFF